MIEMFLQAGLKCVADHNLENVDVKDKKHGNKNTVQKASDNIRKEMDCEGYHCSDTEVLTAVLIKIQVFMDGMLCQLANSYQLFGV
jgi:hypothetical protein